MLQIKPYLEHQSYCPHCQTSLNNKNILWQGMFTCVNSECPNCDTKIIEDLRVGHANIYPYQIDINRHLVFGDRENQEWLGDTLVSSLHNPHKQEITFTKEVFEKTDNIIILNCIDYLYGHCLLKLLNAERHLKNNSDYGLIVIIQKFMRWMVPEGVAEIWTVDIPLKIGNKYYPDFNSCVQKELERFSKVYISKAYCHPSQFDITNFSRVKKHNFREKEYRVSFIWREDRIWCKSPLWGVLRRLGLIDIALRVQNRNIQKLFRKISSQIPQAKYTVVGFGCKTKFPNWIEDLRVDKFDEDTEIKLCQIYSESRLVIGVHGSNMLLPSAHACMTLDLMPKIRWRNFIADILYQESDPKLASFKYRCMPIEISIKILAFIGVSMLMQFDKFKSLMTLDQEF